MGITFAFVLLFQLPNLYFNVLRRPAKNAHQNVTMKQLEGLTAAFHAQKYLPPFWVSFGARALAEGRPLLGDDAAILLDDDGVAADNPDRVLRLRGNGCTERAGHCGRRKPQTPVQARVVAQTLQQRACAPAGIVCRQRL